MVEDYGGNRILAFRDGVTGLRELRLSDAPATRQWRVTYVGKCEYLDLGGFSGTRKSQGSEAQFTHPAKPKPARFGLSAFVAIAPGLARPPWWTRDPPEAPQGQKRGTIGLEFPQNEKVCTSLASSSGLYLWKCPA